MPAFFITGTDTDVGKTYFSCWLVASWRAQGLGAAGIKPISSGSREDAELLREAGEKTLSLDEINPIYFQRAATPQVAAEEEQREIDFAHENQRIAQLARRFTHLAIEGVGGWRVPLARGYDVRDWARDLKMPVVVIARAGLGTLNHTQLTVDSIRDAGLTCAGVVLNSGMETPSPDFDFIRGKNLDLLRDLLLLPVFDFDRRAHAAGKVPVWLGGKEI